MHPTTKGDILVTWQQSQVFGTQPVFIFSPRVTRRSQFIKVSVVLEMEVN